jgi:hypothetical protein
MGHKIMIIICERRYAARAVVAAAAAAASLHFEKCPVSLVPLFLPVAAMIYG